MSVIACPTGADFSLEIKRTPSAEKELNITWSAPPGEDYAVLTTSSLNDSWTGIPPASLSWLALSQAALQAVSPDEKAQFYKAQARPSAYDPDWANAVPSRTNRHPYQSDRSPEENGSELMEVLRALNPGDFLAIEEGVYSFDSFAALDLQGTPGDPIWIAAAPEASVVITRPDARQNVINVGVNDPTRYVCFRGLEFKGGSHGVRLYDCREVWIDRCRIHETGDVGLSANARDTSRLFITRNEIWNTGGTGEGMYLGGNNASVIMSESVIALNHVHHTNQGTVQGDGIEVKQGSWGNWIVENHVHDCKYPCILVYGTAGEKPNVVERNLCYRSDDNVLQIQGECVVRNNLVMAGRSNAFASQPHQGEPTRLRIVHNTFINSGNAVRLSGWKTGAEMIFANNACYSESGEAVRLIDAEPAVFAGNIAFGASTVEREGFQSGNGLDDFINVSWDAVHRDARPSKTSALRTAASPDFAVPTDITNQPRRAPHAAGCCEP